MIHTSTQLKALVRNKSHGDNAKAMTLIRNFVMERFLERISLSKYSGNLILKGGLLIASMVGLDNRATMDIDTTIRNYNLSAKDAERMETIISRGTLNTRMRDYYDLMILNVIKSDAINYVDLAKALEATSRKRNSYELLSAPEHIVKQIKSDTGLMEQWQIYQRKYDYAAVYHWEDIVTNIERLFGKLNYEQNLK